MSNNTFRPLLERLGGNPANTFVGVAGELFYDPATGNLRLSDGVTPGGVGIAETSALESEFIGPWIYFSRPDNSPGVVDTIFPNLIIARDPNGGGGSGCGRIYNAAIDTNGCNANPTGTSWNSDGWSDLSNVATRQYISFDDMIGQMGGWWSTYQEVVMHDTQNDTYWAIKFLSWDSGTNEATGAFSYVRRQINTGVFFERVDTNDEETAYVGGDVIAPNLIITRANGGAIFNWGDNGDGGRWENGWNTNTSVYGTLWNREGWSDLSNLKTRQFLPFPDVMNGANYIGEFIIGREFVMWDTLNDKYYAIKFTRWGQGEYAGGFTYPGFAYMRKLIDTTKLTTGIKFEDGSIQHTAYTDKVAGTIKPVLQKTSMVNYRYINPEDIGKMIILTSDTTNTLHIPVTTTAEFPLGSTITIVNRTGGNVTVSIDNDNSQNGVIYGAGTSNSGTSWIIPDLGGGNVATLIRLSQSQGPYDGQYEYYTDWMLVGAGISLD